MNKMFFCILFLLGFTQIVVGQKFCENDTEDIFTMDSVTFVSNQNLIYRTFVGQPFGNISFDVFNYIFEKPGDSIKFAVHVDTGFMVTKIPDCSPEANECKELQKLKGLGFVIGVDGTLGAQAYKAYRFENITGKFPTPIIQSSGLPFNLKGQSGIAKSQFWPFTSNSVGYKYLHSTFDEKSSTIIHLIYGESAQKLYVLNLENVNQEFKTYDIKPEKYKTYIFKGFFHWKTDDQKMNKTTYIIGRLDSGSEDEVLKLQNDFSLKTQNEILLQDLYGCRAQETSTTNMTTIEASDQTMTSEEGPVSETASTESGEISSMTTTTETGTKATESPSSSWIVLWILIVVGVVALIIIIIVICYIRQRNSNQIEDQSKPANMDNNTLRDKQKTVRSQLNVGHPSK